MEQPSQEQGCLHKGALFSQSSSAVTKCKYWSTLADLASSHSQYSSYHRPDYLSRLWHNHCGGSAWIPGRIHIYKNCFLRKRKLWSQKQRKTLVWWCKNFKKTRERYKIAIHHKTYRASQVTEKLLQSILTSH